jgi:hypothetical protein
MLDVNEFLLENKIRTMKLCDKMHDLLYKVSHRDVTLFIRKLIF